MDQAIHGPAPAYLFPPLPNSFTPTLFTPVILILMALPPVLGPPLCRPSSPATTIVICIDLVPVDILLATGAGSLQSLSKGVRRRQMCGGRGVPSWPPLRLLLYLTLVQPSFHPHTW